MPNVDNPKHSALVMKTFASAFHVKVNSKTKILPGCLVHFRRTWAFSAAIGSPRPRPRRSRANGTSGGRGAAACREARGGGGGGASPPTACSPTRARRGLALCHPGRRPGSPRTPWCAAATKSSSISTARTRPPLCAWTAPTSLRTIRETLSSESLWSTSHKICAGKATCRSKPARRGFPNGSQRSSSGTAGPGPADARKVNCCQFCRQCQIVLSWPNPLSLGYRSFRFGGPAFVMRLYSYICVLSLQIARS